MHASVHSPRFSPATQVVVGLLPVETQRHSRVNAVPVLLHMVLGDRIRPVLAAARDWLQRNNSTITTIVIGAVGLLVAGNGVSAL